MITFLYNYTKAKPKSRTTIYRFSQHNPALGRDQAIAMNKIDMYGRQSLWQSGDVMDTVGVVAGVKPAAVITWSDDTSKLITVLGLAQQRAANREFMAISRSEKMAQELAGLFTDWRVAPRRSPDDERRIGKLLGYPETATEYYLKRLPTVRKPANEQLPVIQPIKFDNTVHSDFSQFILSPEHWLDEVSSYALPLELATRELAPRTYRMIKRRVRHRRIKALLYAIVGKKAKADFESNVAISRV